MESNDSSGENPEPNLDNLVVDEPIHREYMSPTVTHYRLPNIRPTVAQIRTGNITKPTKAYPGHKKVYPAQEGAAHTVGTIVGVLSPCFVNIVNVIYFTRLPFVVGTAGGLATIVGLILSTLLVAVSVCSLSAVATNGDVESGGAYYLLSRTIGPEVGGACGVCLAFASLIGAAQANIGMMEQIVILYQPFTLFGSKIWDVRIFSSIITAIITYLATYSFQIRMAMFCLIWIGVLMYFLGLIFPQYTKSREEIECSSKRFMTNWYPEGNFTINHFFYTFSIIFPGFGGILAGSNSSGSLKRPQVSIPLGTILALTFGTLIYISTGLTLALCHPRDQLLSIWSSPIQDSSLFTWFVFVAIVGSSIAKAITGLGAGPMVLRAMASDGLIPKFFNNYSRSFGAVFAIIFCLWGNFNSISSLSSSLFLCVFAFLNYGLYLAKHAKVLSFRPHFKFYLSEIAIVTCILCIISIILINLYTAIIAFTFAAVFYYYTWQRHLDLPWGSLTQSKAYNTGLNAALRLRHVPPHPKLYRPNVVLLIHGPPADHHFSISFLSQMLHDKGLAIVARIFNEDTPLTEVIEERNKETTITSGKSHHVFYETVVAETMEEALMKVMLLSGFGSLRANIVFIEFDEELKEKTAHFIEDVLDRHWSVVILRNPRNIDDNGSIDCWCLSEDGGLALLLASILARGDRKLRVLTFARVEEGEGVHDQSFIIKHILRKFRIKADVIIVPFTDDSIPSHHIQMQWREKMKDVNEDPVSEPYTQHFMRVSDSIRAYSSHATVAVISLPLPRTAVPGEIYMRWLHLLSSILPPVLFVRGNGTPALSWQL
ncbi:Amino acid permease family protein [Tritrichomonas foetus]|uniref:Amino acid permease family protein n=1 Tax=Tritrichomonas foetus TaxID=1144522 RepID=A0A1J4L1D0_9EUKA|nr:Amino acid permease family protein [Tritrichomonas foetus]|eukprot:OHT17327.1 Amino acid permease family protein [Tritrichomonas foetus]